MNETPERKNPDNYDKQFKRSAFLNSYLHDEIEPLTKTGKGLILDIGGLYPKAVAERILESIK
jgi:hypothetical protein